ncbi:MAG: imidazole glycerol phosphate synthase subunit HisH [Clostridia bacterium]|nr:imidazole glycerol phosphate synthase subunit HisH [Clostridia bacterium]
MLAIVDYGVGNLFSLSSSLKYSGIASVITSDASVIEKSDRIILPGVGAFKDAINKLRQSGLDKVILKEAEKGKPIMGICLGMQLLFEKSYEYGEHTGLGLLNGEVIPMKGKMPSQLKIPHIGWNKLETKRENEILKYLHSGDYVYFVHSFFVEGENENAVAVTDYGLSVTAAVAKNNIYGCQFHPEKSGEVGLSILKAFNEISI